MPTTSEAFAAVRARLDAAGIPYPVYYNRDEAQGLPDTPEVFAFIEFRNGGSVIAGFGGGRGDNLYRNSAMVLGYVFSPAGYGLEAVADYAELVAAPLRSYRDGVISCFNSDVVETGQGTDLSVPGLRNEVSNYQYALVECSLIFDLVG